MKLYLSSYRIPTPEDLFGLVGKTPEETRVAVIPNAKDFRPEKEQKIQDVLTDLGKLGLIKSKLVDLNQYKPGGSLEDDLSSFDMMYVCGGNTTDLLYAMQASGFQEVVGRLTKKGLVYLGESAGAIAAGKSLKGFESPNDPPHVPQKPTNGLALVNKIVIPHADNPMYNDRLPVLIDMYSNDELVIINDNQALVVDGNETKIVTG